jgi:hypothetical protein
MYVCTSGATSGELCNIHVKYDGMSATYEDGQWVHSMIVAKSIYGKCAVAQGDSGGPVFSYVNSSTVHAQGIISAMAGESVSCPGLNPVGGSTVIFQRVVDAVAAFKGSLVIN